MEEMYYCGDQLYYDLDGIIDDCTDDFKSEDDIPQDFEIEYQECELKPIFSLNVDLVCELIHDHFEENSTEEGKEWDCVQRLIEKYMNLDAMNSEAPELWFPYGKKKTLSRDFIISNINERGGFQ